MAYQARSIAKYILLPGILPRVRELFFSGFGRIAVMMAIVYGAVRLLPRDHPYLNPANEGRFGIRHVMAEARRNLVFSWAHADQVILYFALLAGFILLVVQFFLLIGAFIVGGAFAQPKTFSDFFVTKEPEKDIAFMLLDRVFGFGSGGGGTKALFGSEALGKVDGKMHEALHALFLFYNTGILAVAMIVMLYYLMVIVAETAQSGTPFGRRFNKAWAPMRMIVAVGLLTPLMWGMNGAQLVTLYAAKWGSGAATNGWIYFLDHLQDSTPAGPRESLVVRPSMPPLSVVQEFIYIARTCMFAEYYMYGREINGYLVDTTKTEVGLAIDKVEESAQKILKKMQDGAGDKDLIVDTVDLRHEISQLIKKIDEAGGAEYLPMKARMEEILAQVSESWKTPSALAGVLDSLSKMEGRPSNDTGPRNVLVYPAIGAVGADFLKYDDAVRLRGHRNLRLVFGEAPEGGGKVRPICGELMFQTVDTAQPAALHMQRKYWDDLVPYVYTLVYFTAQNHVLRTIPNGMRDPTLEIPVVLGEGSSCRRAAQLSGSMESWADCMKQEVAERIEKSCPKGTPKCPYAGYVDGAREAQLGEKSIWAEEYRKYGWGGAAIWYNKIAEMNGAFMTAVQNLPRPVLYPEVMEYVAEQKRAGDENTNPAEHFRPYRANGDRIDFIHPADAYFASLYYQAQSFWQTSYQETRGTSAADIIVSIFGLTGLFDMRKNADIHPVAQLVGVGKGLIDSTILNLGLAAGGGLMGIAGHILGWAPVTAIGKTAMSFAMSIATIGLALGFVLFYVIPFMPFMYFFFAVGGWVKAIFEALVGVPLWAIAHMRIDGDGLPGPKAMGGYYLIFEIFMRPILIVFGLIAGIIIFSAQVQILNEVWDLVTDNLTGHSGAAGSVEDARAAKATGTTMGVDSVVATARGVIDQFFYTVLYAIVVYMMALSSFKMVDMMPKAFNRWLGSNAAPFTEQGDAASQTLAQMYVGTNIVINRSMGTLGMLAMRS